MPDFKYDTAISFLNEDENLAIQIADKIGSSYSTFIYTKKQVELVGADGEKILNEVFARESRIVVVLYRPNWGETPWTRIEKTAIRNRAYEDGYDFSIFVILDNTASPPKYLPKTQMWHDYERWGLDGLIPIIKYKVVEKGGNEKPETIEDRARRAHAEAVFKRHRIDDIGSLQAIGDGQSEFEGLCDNIMGKINVFNEKHTLFDITIKQRNKHSIIISSGDFDSVVRFAHGDNARPLTSVCLYKLKKKRNSFNDSKYDQVINETYLFDIDRNSKKGWSDTKETRFYTSDEISDYAIDLLLKRLSES